MKKFYGTKSYKIPLRGENHNNQDGLFIVNNGVWIFAYGTLNDPAIQLKLYHRKLNGRPDQLNQYHLSTITQTVNNLLHTYPIAIFSGNPSDVIPGMVYNITPQELEVTDIYEGAEYRRVPVLLQSGASAWIYVM